MRDVLISVIVTVYNNAEYLEQCLDSVKNQTYKNLEIIVVDDGSNDDSGQICDTFAKEDARIKVIHEKNSGPARARKKGCESSLGEYISIIDADDWLETEMIEKLYKACITNRADVSMCGRTEEYCNNSVNKYHGYKEGFYDKAQLISEIYPYMIVNKDFFEWGIFPSYWDKLFKSELLIPFVDAVEDSLPMGNDAAGVYPCLLNAESIYILHECLYHYRQYEGSMVRNVPKSKELREGFSLLYKSVDASLEKYKNIFDCREQWLKYVLFLMIPRADVLYENIMKLEYLFPFPNVKKGSRVAIYGMGLYGKRLYYFLQESGFCELVVAFDRNYETFEENLYKVDSPENIKKYDFDHIVVAMSYAKAIKQVKSFLMTRVENEKINTVDEKTAMEHDNLKELGIL